jgi:hypothetical protein
VPCLPRHAVGARRRGRLRVSLVQISFFDSVHPPPLTPRRATALNFVIPKVCDFFDLPCEVLDFERNCHPGQLRACPERSRRGSAVSAMSTSTPNLDLNKNVILKRSASQIYRSTEGSGAESKDLEDACWPMLSTAFRPPKPERNQKVTTSDRRSGEPALSEVEGDLQFTRTARKCQQAIH